MEPCMLDVGLAGMPGFTKSMFLFYIWMFPKIGVPPNHPF